MLKNKQKMAVLALFDQFSDQSEFSLSLPELRLALQEKGITVAERTLRRWLTAWVDDGILLRTGNKRSTRYLLRKNDAQAMSFLQSIEPAKRSVLLSQLRDLWTHSSTALEGNTLSLGDTHSVLELGLTISGKPLREHQELVGHARAIDLIYQMIDSPLTKEQLFELHKAVQTDVVIDIYQPIGKWKKEANYASSITSDGEAVMIEYAAPNEVDALMTLLIDEINKWNTESLNDKTAPAVDNKAASTVNIKSAPAVYAQIHMACVHIHPFADGNGRIARLLANLLLLKSGLPPLIIDREKRREYIECLADYQTNVGQLSSANGLWPKPELLDPFADFCAASYQITSQLMAKFH